MESKRRQISVLDHSLVKTLKMSASIDDSVSYTDFRMRCINRTHTGIWNKTRLGVSTFLKPQVGRHGYEERFDVELEWRVPIKDLRAITDEIRDNILGNSHLVREIMLAHDDQVRMLGNGNGYGYATVTVLVSIRWAELAAMGGVIYISELDLQLVAEGHKTARIEHPFGPTEMVNKSFSGAVPHISNQTLVFSLKAVHNGRMQDKATRFMSLGGEVYHIPIERDTNLSDGVHLVCRNPVSAINAREAVKDMCHQHFDFMTADKLFRLKLTPEEALIDGDRETFQKRQLADLTHQQRMEELARKEQTSNDDFIRSSESALQKDTLAQRRFREETVKEHTRNFSDWIKLVGGMMAAVAGVIGFVNKLKPT